MLMRNAKVKREFIHMTKKLMTCLPRRAHCLHCLMSSGCKDCIL